MENVNSNSSVNLGTIPPLYPYSRDYAMENGDRDTWIFSHRASCACRVAVDDAIHAGYNGFSLDTSYIKPVIDQYGVDRVDMIIAGTIKHADWDGRYSNRNRDWAEKINTSLDTSSDLLLRSHPGLINLMADDRRRSREKSTQAVLNDAVPAVISGSSSDKSPNPAFSVSSPVGDSKRQSEQKKVPKSDWIKRKNEQMDAVMKELEKGVRAVFDSDRYKEYLKLVSRLPNYSVNNQLLILTQCPQAQMVASYHAWKELNCQVRHGEKGIHIICPAPYKSREIVPRTNPATGEILCNPDGSEQTISKETTHMGYTIGYTFDISQVDGAEHLVTTLGSAELTADVKGVDDLIQAITQACPTEIRYEDISNCSKGYYHLTDDYIAVKAGMHNSQTAKTLLHEWTHSILDRRGGGTSTVTDQHTKEVRAEAVAYVVCTHYNLDTSDYSFGYIANWSTDKNIPELREELQTIRDTSRELISQIDHQLAEIHREEAQTESLVPEMSPYIETGRRR